MMTFGSSIAGDARSAAFLGIGLKVKYGVFCIQSNIHRPSFLTILLHLNRPPPHRWRKRKGQLPRKIAECLLRKGNVIRRSVIVLGRIQNRQIELLGNISRLRVNRDPRIESQRLNEDASRGTIGELCDSSLILLDLGINIDRSIIEILISNRGKLDIGKSLRSGSEPPDIVARRGGGTERINHGRGNGGGASDSRPLVRPSVYLNPHYNNRKQTHHWSRISPFVHGWGNDEKRFVRPFPVCYFLPTSEL